MAARVLMLAACLTLAWAQYQQQQTTPIPILKQINRQNEDGSYSYGYEGADGSYKIETKQSTGEVFGKYGYVDDGGNRREVEYGASRRGFEPAGTGIDVAPPTLTNNNNNNNYLGPNDQDDGQYREDPSVYYKDPKYNDGYSYPGTESKPAQQYSQPAPKYNAPAPTYSQPSYSQPKYSQPSYSQPSYSQQSYSQPSYSQQSYSEPSYSQPSYSQPRYSQQRYEQDSYNSQPTYRQPISVDPNLFRGHPASNFDINTGSYSVNYKK